MNVIQVRSWKGSHRWLEAPTQKLGISDMASSLCTSIALLPVARKFHQCILASHSLDVLDVVCHGKPAGFISWVEECSCNPTAPWIIARGSSASSSQLATIQAWHESYHGIVTHDLMSRAWFTLSISLHMPRSTLLSCCIRPRDCGEDSGLLQIA